MIIFAIFLGHQNPGPGYNELHNEILKGLTTSNSSPHIRILKLFGDVKYLPISDLVDNETKEFIGKQLSDAQTPVFVSVAAALVN